MKRPLTLITGASSGFGLLACVALAREGFHVAATMRSLDKQDALLTAATEAGVKDNLTVLQLDVTDHAAVGAVVTELAGRFGGIDLLLNNAGYAAGGPIEEFAMEEWRRQFETNFFGVVALTQAVLPYMREQGKGTIINLSSVSGLVGFPAMGPYSASKFAVEGFSESLRLEMLPYGVKVVLVEPGAFKTDIWKKGLGGVAIPPDSPYAPVMDALLPQINHIARTAGDPQDVVAVIVKAAKSNNPTLRYPVGKGVKQSALLKALLPWRMIERAIAKSLPRSVTASRTGVTEGK